MIYAAIMGYGTIGSGVYEVLEKNSEQIAEAAGQPIRVRYVLDLREFPGTPAQDKIVHDFSIIEKDPEIEIVVETMGGLNPAYPFVKACLLAGKHVATSNKALVAAHGTELLEIARRKGVNFLFEASVGGGIPIIRTLYRCLAGEKITEITGILNGTTNYILTKMERDGTTFEQALKEAQRLGYAEQNPEADVEGYDTCRKIAILTALATGKEVDYRDIPTEGITRICADDLRYADAFGLALKLVGSSRIRGDKVTVWVAPLMVGRSNPLYGVSGVYNAILVKGNMLGTSMYYGSGAGKLPTASAVVADMIEEAQNLKSNVSMGWNDEKLQISPSDDSVCRYFLRISGNPDELGHAVENCLGECRTALLEGTGGFAVLTKIMDKDAFDLAMKKLADVLSQSGDKVDQIIRVEA